MLTDILIIFIFLYCNISHPMCPFTFQFTHPRKIGLPEKQCTSQLKVEFDKRQYLCKLLIITKTNELLELSRND